eukprot:TRINITY_DN9648_c0_g1_i2.p1 TRINITY_DN9648_c0_g1~~TRINITY_DN9648_c0_g1_i2.p1  ORF type:complete len:191 (+),score=53.20 TRINITY_DN9648_c0_g1_i2:243-815(+)
MPVELSDALIGQKVSLKTTVGETHDGVIFGFDQQQNSLALFENLRNSGNSRQSFRIFNLSYVAQVTPASKDGERAENFPEHFLPGAELPKINTDKLKDKADQEREKRRDAMGENVSIEAQDVFDAISRTLGSRWEKSTIIIMDVVSLSEPYGPENLSHTETAKQRENAAKLTSDQVKKILEDRQRKMKSS